MSNISRLNCEKRLSGNLSQLEFSIKSCYIEYQMPKRVVRRHKEIFLKLSREDMTSGCLTS